jgi:transposase
MPKLTFAQSREEADYSTVLAEYRRALAGRKKERLLMVLKSLEGIRVRKIAQIVKRSVQTVRYWLTRWNIDGVIGLEDHKHTGRPSLLSPHQQQQLIDFVIEQVKSKGRITCREVARWVKETFNRQIHPESIRRLLENRCISWQKAGTADHRANKAAQQAFVEQLHQRIDDEPDTRFFFATKSFFS